MLTSRKRRISPPNLVALSMVLGFSFGVVAIASAEEIQTCVGTKQVLPLQKQGDKQTVGPPMWWVGQVYTGQGCNIPDDPWLVKAGPSSTTWGTSVPDAQWTWDPTDPCEDSLSGWWPIRRAYSITGGSTLLDTDRPWWALDYGNQGNYVLNSIHYPRTFGVLGYWHADGGATTPNHPGLSWVPLSGSKSAWCGLRGHGDNTYIDPITRNAYNQTVLEYNGENGGGTGTSKHFPGYGSQWDQLLYRDVVIAAGAKLDLSFQYATNMSTSASATASIRTGWFQYDPTIVGGVAVNGPNVGFTNFVRNTGAGQPADSFMVYIGVPVNIDSLWTANGELHLPGPGPHGVYDLQRRWLSEVLDLSRPIRELMHAGGDNNTTFNISNVDLGSFFNYQQGGTRRLRIVFRCKTNRGFDDQTGGVTGAYNSGGAGAVRIDNVAIGGTGVSGPATGALNDFESDLAIDNTVESGGFALNSWHTTGKPPQAYFHTHPLGGGDLGSGNVYQALLWSDLCGPPGIRDFCNMRGVVISAGDHGLGEDLHDMDDMGGETYPGDSQVMDGMISPTINLVTDGVNPNAQGVRPYMSRVREYYIAYDVYAGSLDSFFSGSTWTFGFQSYPAMQSNGIPCWGEIRYPGYQLFDPGPEAGIGVPHCVHDLEPAMANGLILTSNASFSPDSLRIFLGKNVQCFRFAYHCDEPNAGAYFDNVSLGLRPCDDSQPPIPTSCPAPMATLTIATDPWRWLNDSFPFNETPGLPGTAAFDTTTALLRTGLNIAQETPGALNRPDIPGDSVVVVATNVNGRVDMVFRIKPGPGNYVVDGVRTSGLRTVPTVTTTAIAGDGSFWGQYMSCPGDFASPNAAALHAASSSGWSENVWNSARCDTAEINLFPVGNNPDLTTLDPHFKATFHWMATYHENDCHYATLGIAHNRCFLTSPSGPVSSDNITCSSIPGWASNPSSGFDGSQTTKEGTQIIPDGLLTPGSHVEYFFRNSELSDPSTFVMVPDTLFVTPQNREGPNLDGHRWQEFSVLPDRWKDPLFGDPDATGMACMLVVNVADRRGDERVWSSIADSSGATIATHIGGHDGWKAHGTDLLTNPVTGLPIDVSTNPYLPVAAHRGQAGSSWDLYGIKGGESLISASGQLGSRLAPVPTGPAAGKVAKLGPTKEMLRKYYRGILMLTGDLSFGVLGPYVNRGQDDVALLEDYIAVTSNDPPRFLYVVGDGFVQSEFLTGNIAPPSTTPHLDLLQSYLGTSLRNPDYRVFGNAFSSYVDWTTDGPLLNGSLTYSVGNECMWGNDVLSTFASSPLSPSPTVLGRYQNLGFNGPYFSSVYVPTNAFRQAFSVVDGWDIQHFFGHYPEKFQAGASPSLSRLIHYQFTLLPFLQEHVQCGLLRGPGLVVVGVPDEPAPVLKNFIVSRNNPLSTGWATIQFGITRPGRVRIQVYDLAGRRVRTLADQEFTAGDHQVVWDGTDDTGAAAPRGAYFVRTLAADLHDIRKLVLLK